MDSKLKEIIDISIKLELNASKLYGLFSRTFEEDKNFWHKLSEEEESHALLLKSAKKEFASSEYFPTEMLAQDVDELIHHNLQLERTIYRFKTNPPSRKLALQTAFQLELSVGEIHYQKSMIQASPSGFLKIFQELNTNDKDHAKRIREYSTANNIAILEDS